MSLERSIIKIIDPTIIKDEMKFADEGSGGNGGIHLEKALTDIYPLVKINNYYFVDTELLELRIDSSEFYPRCFLSVIISDGVFISKAFPKDGDVISIMIRSKIKEFKPLRADFEITSCRMTDSTDETGDISIINFEGVLRVPKLFGETCKVYKDASSFDALMDIASDLELGYASNETQTQDIMNWICGYDTYNKFIKDVTSVSYKDDNSFYTSFIDWYYYLNFVNVNQQFSTEEKLDDAVIHSLLHSDSLDESKKMPVKNNKLFLTNFSQTRSTNFFINNYSLVNKSGSINMEAGYRRFLQFYDVNDKKYESFFIDPLNTDNSENKIILKGRAGENVWKDRVKYKWMGVQYSKPQHNVHENYHFAQVQNFQNNKEIDKLTLNVQLSKANWNLYRYQRVPILIMNEGNRIRKKITEGKEEREQGNSGSEITWDKFLSGYYVLMGMVYRWERNFGWTQELKLSKREWDPQ